MQHGPFRVAFAHNSDILVFEAIEVIVLFTIKHDGDGSRLDV